MGRKRVTIEDVARAAGVSRQTVSRAINNQDEISPQTRARVLRVVDEMGYRPSGIARGLATRRTRTLGLVIPDVSNPFFSDVTRGAEHVAYAEGYNVFLCNTEEDPQRELAVLRSLEEKRVDGVVLCSSRLDDDRLSKVVARQSAAVLVNRRLELSGEGNGVGVVMLDDERGGRLATQHLLVSGHRAVGFLAGPLASRSGRQRTAGYRAALEAAGLPYNAEWTRHCSPGVEGGRVAADELLSVHPELSALFCYNDLVAVGALQACARLQLQVPRDVAIVSFDDIPLAALVTPPLTTCRVPRYDLGLKAMRLLLDQLERESNGADRSMGREIVLRPELVVRASAP
jgi:LacI family transcriptional regulator